MDDILPLVTYARRLFLVCVLLVLCILPCISTITRHNLYNGSAIKSFLLVTVELKNSIRNSEAMTHIYNYTYTVYPARNHVQNRPVSNILDALHLLLPPDTTLM